MSRTVQEYAMITWLKKLFMKGRYDVMLETVNSFKGCNDSPRTIPVFVPISATNKEVCWEKIRNETIHVAKRPILSEWGVAILRKGLDHVVKSVIVEPTYICKDHRDLVSHYYSRKFRPNSGLCSRLHFFTKSFQSLSELASEKTSDLGYIGYSVIRPVPNRCLGRTVIDPRLLQIGFGDDLFCLSASSKVHLCGLTLDVQGYPYMSQDNEAMVCAHTALWGVCRYFSERYNSYAELRPYELVNLTSTYEGRTCPRHGMIYQDYSKILSDFGTFPVIIRFKDDKKNAWADLCAYIESGFPLLTSIAPQESNGDGHVVAVIGHTADYSLGKPDENDIVDHTDFFGQVVVVDDNVFPYQRLGKNGALNYSDAFNPKGQGFTIDSIHTAVCPLPEKVFLTAEAARLIANSFIIDPDILKLIKEFGNGPWVKRLFLATGYSFQAKQLQNARKRELSFSDNIDLILALTHLPHFVWVLQVGPKDKYIDASNPTCTAEVVIDATAGKDDPHAVIYARIGNRLLFPGTKMYTINNSDAFFPIYRHNLGS